MKMDNRRQNPTFAFRCFSKQRESRDPSVAAIKVNAFNRKHVQTLNSAPVTDVYQSII